MDTALLAIQNMQHDYYLSNAFVFRICEAIAQDGSLLTSPAGTNLTSMAKKLAGEIKLLVSPINF